MAGAKPKTGRMYGAYVLSLFGGILVMVGGAGLSIAGAVLDSYFGNVPAHVACGIIGIVCGLLMVGAASLAYQQPSSRAKYGGLIVALSVAGLVFALGGLLIGSLLGFIGGVMFTMWKPPSMEEKTREVIIREREIVRVPCQYCGNLVDVTTIRCPYCGAAPR